MIDFFQGMVLALVQGITAWIPVSSKTQVLLVANGFFATPFETALAFALILHLGDLLAGLARYRREYADALACLAHPMKLPKVESPNPAHSRSAFLGWSLAATVVVALPLYVLVRKAFANLPGQWLLAAVGVVLLVMAAFTAVAKRMQSGGAPLTRKNAILTGLAQGLAVIPGISRSGITQCALLLQGVEPEKAVDLSFLMAAPMIAAAFIGFFAVSSVGGFSWEVAAVGIMVAAIASYFTMDALSKLAHRIPAQVFLAAVGVLALVPLVLHYLFPLAVA